MTEKTKHRQHKTAVTTVSASNKNMRLSYTILPKPAPDHRNLTRHTPASNLYLRKEPRTSLRYRERQAFGFQHHS